jgi:hypothetical protein
MAANSNLTKLASIVPTLTHADTVAWWLAGKLFFGREKSLRFSCWDR